MQLCQGQNFVWNMWIYSDALILLKDQGMVERLSQAMIVTLVFHTLLQIL